MVKMETLIIELKPKKFTKLTQNKKENKPIIHSYTLFSAILSSYKKIFGEKDFNDSKDYFKELVLTSAFPKIKADKEIFFLPYPKGKHLFDIKNKDDRTLMKKLKKISFIDFEIIKEWVEKYNKEEEKIQINQENIKGLFYAKKSVEIPFNRITELKTMIYRMPKVEKDKLKNNELFEKDVFVFNENFSFYFLIQVPKEIKSEIKKVIETLEGIGGKRSSGYGYFEIKEIKNEELIKFLTKTSNDENLMLVNSVPLIEELEPLSYTIVEFGGFFDITNKNPKQAKPQIFYLEEGSFIKNKGKITNEEKEFRGNKLFIYKKPWVI